MLIQDTFKLTPPSSSSIFKWEATLKPRAKETLWAVLLYNVHKMARTSACLILKYLKVVALIQFE